VRYGGDIGKGEGSEGEDMNFLGGVRFGDKDRATQVMERIQTRVRGDV